MSLILKVHTNDFGVLLSDRRVTHLITREARPYGCKKYVRLRPGLVFVFQSSESICLAGRVYGAVLSRLQQDPERSFDALSADAEILLDQITKTWNPRFPSEGAFVVSILLMGFDPGISRIRCVCHERISHLDGKVERYDHGDEVGVLAMEPPGIEGQTSDRWIRTVTPGRCEGSTHWTA